MAIKLGVFTMPFHHPSRDYRAILEEDQEAIVLADQLGFSEVFVGEHLSSWSERITSPLIFLASLASRTKLAGAVNSVPATAVTPSARSRTARQSVPKGSSSQMK